MSREGQKKCTSRYSFKQMINFFMKVEYSGIYPNLCSGVWTIVANGETHIFRGEMGTYGTYQKWSFDANWSDNWESYTDGMRFPEWRKSVTGANVLNKFPGLNKRKQEELFNMIQKLDFRIGSCGGCI